VAGLERNAPVTRPSNDVAAAPEYFILDGKGRLRYRLTTLASAAAQLPSIE
jgi:hypothetical protein